MDSVLVVGARKKSLGDAIAIRLRPHFKVTTAGVTDEDFVVEDLRKPWLIDQVIEYRRWQHVICTVGVNEETAFPDTSLNVFQSDMIGQFNVNCVVPMMLLSAWINDYRSLPSPSDPCHFVAISSNSAQVPRSKSMAYCASKAALSHSIRCAARSLPPQFVAWALEPGWIQGTPMSSEVHNRLPDTVSHMRGGAEADKNDLASILKHNLMLMQPRVLNGMTIRLDGGEQ